MANRSYLYSLSNRPTSYADRPESISGLSEWPYYVPFSYRVLMSGDPQLCSSLIWDGFESESPDEKTKLYAISSDFEVGFSRLKKFFSILRPLVASTAPDLVSSLHETITFLNEHYNRYLLLETIELDSMSFEGEAELRICVEKEIETCRAVGAAIDALPANLIDAGNHLKSATLKESGTLLDLFYGLRLDDDYDNTRDDKTEYPLGLYWDEVLCFEIWNRAEFEANRS